MLTSEGCSKDEMMEHKLLRIVRHKAEMFSTQPSSLFLKMFSLI